MNMIQKHCPECRTPLIEKELEGEGIPTTLLIDCQTGKIIVRYNLDATEAKLAELLP